MFSALLPFIFLSGFIASAKTFIFYYNRYKARGDEILDPWYPEQSKEKKAYQAIRSFANTENQHHVMAGLMLRAKVCMEQLSHVRTSKPALTKLFQTQLVDGPLYTSLLVVEASLMEEMAHVMQEAKSISPEWPRTLFTTAVHMCEFEKLVQIKRDMVEYRAKEEHLEKKQKSDMGVDTVEEDEDLLILDNCDHLLD